MNDKELADKVVALGVGKANQIYPDAIGRFYQIDLDADWQTSVNESKFVRDWRVTGALLVLVYDAYANIDDVTQTFEGDPRAIIAACVEALNGEQEVSDESD